ncbi:HAMP domain-containing sensor histidine kinase [Kitasatospora sp. NPDC002040]|uniref:sensor histidine kinase n=1 Tax=Kitasatospora sp. NPDC002040 TaxID=3154661 RepID=UPI00332734CE
MSERRRFAFGVRARAALASLVAAAIAFGVAAVLVGGAVQDSLQLHAMDRAFTAYENVSVKIPGTPEEAYQNDPYVVLAEDGRWLRSFGLTDPRSKGLSFGLDPVGPYLPPPEGADPFFRPVTLDFPSDAGAAFGLPEPTGNSLQFYRARTADTFTSAQLQQYSGIAGLPDQQLSVYTLVDTAQAERTSATVTRLLAWYVAPGGSIFVALMAWLVTGLALRPVEAIRRQMAVIGDGAFDRRVPVPRARDGIARLAETTNVTLGRLERALGEQRRLVADASHELRSPLAALRSSLEVPLTHPQQADWPAVVAGALTDTERLQQLADDLLLLADTEEGREAGGTVALHDLVAEQLAERAVTDPGLTCHGELAEATVPGREVLVGRLLRNLLDNAARHAAGTVTVTLRTADGRAELTVADDGPGIPAADRERVFDRFVRLDTDRARSAGGAGLGLALARTIATSLGGTVAAVEPPGGRGAHLVVQLPLAGR